MRKFLIALLYFILPVVIASYGLDVFISKNLLKSNTSPGNYNAWNDIYKGQVNADVVIYGSSRASMQIDPHILEDSLKLKVYNFGMLGHNFLTQYLRHIEYLKYNPQPKQIIMCVDYFSFEKREDLYESDQFLPYMLWNFNIWRYAKSYDGFSLLDHVVPLVRYVGKATAKKKAFSMAFMKSNMKPLKYKGFKSTDKPWDKTMEEARLKRGIYTISNDTNTVNLFYQFLQECEEQNIKVTLVYTPEYFEEKKLVLNRDETFKFFKQVSTQYNNTFLNYVDDSICYKKEYFYNSLHLNKKGVDLFSKKLAHDLKKLDVVEK
ncbi:hypothetical protein [Confluentibacter flavum]|uniref:SGNH/GDSL hydrolase family protein n=1 Tax=Confluentibacter flavum TaxID=1909700 RepID=A0A2N3HP42_9FLAO|nr:hypothetical protein [Confluentibacter flavum]PKQ46730.1 hypothetical protein CSW08_01650 [Confluentibacter flavum]